jgi:hypothetical protein
VFAHVIAEVVLENAPIIANPVAGTVTAIEVPDAAEPVWAGVGFTPVNKPTCKDSTFIAPPPVLATKVVLADPVTPAALAVIDQICKPEIVDDSSICLVIALPLQVSDVATVDSEEKTATITSGAAGVPMLTLVKVEELVPVFWPTGEPVAVYVGGGPDAPLSPIITLRMPLIR